MEGNQKCRILQSLTGYSPRRSARIFPTSQPGDTVRVHVKIKEGDEEHLQAFEGVVISKSKARSPASRSAR